MAMLKVIMGSWREKLELGERVRHFKKDMRRMMRSFLKTRVTAGWVGSGRVRQERM